jgi:hypothetical protein
VVALCPWSIRPRTKGELCCQKGSCFEADNDCDQKISYQYHDQKEAALKLMIVTRRSHTNIMTRSSSSSIMDNHDCNPPISWPEAHNQVSWITTIVTHQYPNVPTIRLLELPTTSLWASPDHASRTSRPGVCSPCRLPSSICHTTITPAVCHT